MFRRTRYYAGIDVGDALIKVAVVAVAGDACNLVKATAVPTPEGSVAEGLVLDPSAVSRAIRDALGEGAKIRVAGAIPVVAGSHLAVRTLTLPPMSKAELKEAARWEAAQYLPFPAEEASYDIVEMSPAAEIVEALFVGCRASVVDGIVAATEAAGMTCLAVEPAPAVLSRLVKRFDSAEHQVATGLAEAAATRETSAVAFLDIGARGSNIGIFKDGLLRVNRAIPVGGVDVDRAITDAVQASPNEVQRLKGTMQLDATGPEGAGLAAAAVRGVISDLCREVQRSMDYFRAQHQWSPIDRMILVGGGSLINGLEAHLSATLETPVSRPDLAGLPARFRSFSRLDQGQLAVMSGAVCAALRGVSN